MERELKLRIVLERPPIGVDFGLQKGRGSAYETVQTQRSEGRDLEFEFSVGVKGSKAMPTLAGPFVQGPAGQRFIYVDIGTYAGQADSCWSRRLKIPLNGITMDMITARGILEARVSGTAKDGAPNCATLKTFNGWKLGRNGR
jgi:hypothetical protein